MTLTNVDPSLLNQMAAGVQSVLTLPAAAIGHALELSALLTATQARAVGCWRYEQGVLHLAGFLAVAEMPADVQTEFVTATRHVPLTQTQFGIVQAVIAGGPAVNHRATDAQVEAVGSIGWLGRFEAASSLATPIFRGTELQGAIAVATRQRIEPAEAVWKLVSTLADRLSRSGCRP